MNDNHSRYELKYKKRWLANLLRKAVKESPSVVLTGARQVGKSTLLQNEQPFASWHYITLDDFDILEQAEKNPQALWAGQNKIVIDEVQKAPNLLSAVKQVIDDKSSQLRFVLSGSANLLLMHHVSESLAGRALYLNLLPMTLGEERENTINTLLDLLFAGRIPKEKKFESKDPIPFMFRGFFPPLLKLKKNDAIVRWLEGYAATYLERDLRQLSQIDSLADFRRVMEALALRTGQVLNQTEVARDTGVKQPTAHRYLNLLETSSLIYRLPAFASNRTKRLIKAPKVYWLDPGLTCYLAGINSKNVLRASREMGSVFECLVFSHLNTLAQLSTPRCRMFYWRTTTQEEVDFVIEKGRKLIAVEVKLSEQPRYSDADNLRAFLREYPETQVGVLVYAGSEIRYLDEKIIALPWTYLAC